MNQLNKIIKFFKDLTNAKDKKRMLENGVILIIIGIVIIIVGGSLFSKGKDKKEPSLEETGKSVEVLGGNITKEDKAEVESKIEVLLSKIEGAGKVDVMVTYVSGKELIPAYDTKKTENETQEKDSGGGTRNIRQNDGENKVVYEESQGGSKKPIILKEINPEVRGVVVVADGASDAAVKESLCRAVQVLLDVPIHKIQVFERSQ